MLRAASQDPKRHASTRLSTMLSFFDVAVQHDKFFLALSAATFISPFLCVRHLVRLSQRENFFPRRNSLSVGKRPNEWGDKTVPEYKAIFHHMFSAG